jgi:hypothetical protein
MLTNSGHATRFLSFDAFTSEPCGALRLHNTVFMLVASVPRMHQQQQKSGSQGSKVRMVPTAASTRKCSVKTPMPVDTKPRQKMDVE